MINEDFQIETVGNTVASSPKWDLLVGNSTGLTFGTDEGRTKVGLAETSTHGVRHTTKPKTNVQRRESSALSYANVGAEMWFDYLSAASYSEQVLSDSPVGYWRLGETSGAADDSSVNGKDGTATNGPTQGVTGLLTGDGNKAASFASGSTNRIAVGDDAVFTNGTVTVECWVKLNAFPTGSQRRWFVNKWVSPVSGFILEAFSGGWRFFVGNGTTTISAVSTTSNNTSVHHIVATFDGTTARLYVDGAASGTTPSFGSATTIPDTVAAIGIGGFATDANFGADATIDEVAIYSGAMSSGRIGVHYQTGIGNKTILPTLATTSIILNYTGAASQVLLKAYHTGTKQCEIIEIVGGVSTILGTLNHAGVNTGKGAIKLEIVGQQARAWFDSGAGYVSERPPDKVVTLAAAYQGSYEWGFQMSTDLLAGEMWVKRFIARDLPTNVPPPPYFKVSSPANVNFTPIQAVISSVAGTAKEIHWEVCPLDSDDIPDPYRDRAPTSVTTRVFWVRPGYSYQVRARESNHDGTFGAWVTFTITASGTKTFATPIAASLPVEKLEFTPDYTLVMEHRSVVKLDTSDTGHDVASTPLKRPRRSITFKFEGHDSSELKPIIEFLARARGKGREFYWTHTTTGESIPLRFDDDDVHVEWTERESVLGLDVGNLEFTATEIATGVVETLTFSLTLDSAFH